MEHILPFLPFFIGGFLAYTLSRFTGVSTSMLLLPWVLYMGATPLESLAFMLTFIVYNNFIMGTQTLRLELKSLTFFPGWRGIIPIVLTFITVLIHPFLGMVIFIIPFVLEFAAAIYKELPLNERPPLSEYWRRQGLAVAFVVLGVVISQFVFVNEVIYPFYYIVVGVAIALYMAFVAHAAAYRDQFRGSWGLLSSGLHLFTGLFGIDGALYAPAMKRSFPSKVDSMATIITMVAVLAGTLVTFAFNLDFSFTALVTAMGSAIAVRMLGIFEHSTKGTFSYLALATIALVVICLLLVQPMPTGFFDPMNILFPQVR